MPKYFNPNHFTRGQKITYGGIPAVVIRHYSDGMWEIRTPGGVTVVSGAEIYSA